MHRKHRIFKELARVEHQLRAVRRLLEEERQPLTASIANRFTGVSSMENNVLVFNVGDTDTDTITPLLADGVTPSGGTVSNVVVTFDDPSATAVVQPDNTILFTGVAPSSGPISGSTAATVTDTNGAVSTWTQAFTVTTNAPPPTPLTASIVNEFSVPA